MICAGRDPARLDARVASIRAASGDDAVAALCFDGGPARLAQAPADQSGVREWADPHRDVDLLLGTRPSTRDLRDLVTRWLPVLGIVAVFLLAAKAHGYQLRLERQLMGYPEVVFGGSNPAWAPPPCH